MSELSKYSDENIINIISSDAETELKKRGYEYGWYKKEKFVGVIYILVNPAFPKLVKIGYADDIQKRLKTLNTTGLPDPFHCYAVYKVKKRLEDLKLHNLIDSLDLSLRHSQNREFYEMDCQKAFEILSAIAQINGDEEQLIKNPLSDSYFSQIPTDNTISLKKQSRLKFGMIGIPIGSTLVFSRNHQITCITKDDDNKVEYNGEVYALSNLAAKLLNWSSAQGGIYFMYNGELLTDIRKRLDV